MVLRQQQEEARTAATAGPKPAPPPADPESMDLDADGEKPEGGEGGEGEEEPLGMKVIVIHPGSQNLRIGLASDALPKTIPNVIARMGPRAEFEENEATPKRIKDDEEEGTEAYFGEEVSAFGVGWEVMGWEANGE